jgi:hypothetical protein
MKETAPMTTAFATARPVNEPRKLPAPDSDFYRLVELLEERAREENRILLGLLALRAQAGATALKKSA